MAVTKLKIMPKIPTVVIVGRTNVGKSSLFNRLTETSKALISRQAGTTRDYNLGTVDWRKKTFQLIDTGGVNIDILKNSIQSLLANQRLPQSTGKSISVIEQEIINQTKEAIRKADMIIMVVDGQAGLLPQDKQLALVLKKLNKPTLLVCNKIDNLRYYYQLNDFFALGLGQPWAVSAANGSGVGDFLDELVKSIKRSRGRRPAVKPFDTIKVAIIGKPNVGKSSLVNKILGENRVIVSPQPQTTREPQDAEISYQNKTIVLIDTAGIRKQAKVKRGLEKITTKKSLNTIKQANIVLLVTDVSQPITKQDSALSGLIKEAGKGIIIIANKWDLITNKTTMSDQEFHRQYQRHFPHLSFAPLLFTSAVTGKNVDKILELVLEVQTQLTKEIPESQLAGLLKETAKQHWPAQAKGPSRPKLLSLKQVASRPPTFILTVGPRQSVHFSYLRFIENRLRDHFGFTGAPVTIRVRYESR